MRTTRRRPGDAGEVTVLLLGLVAVAVLLVLVVAGASRVLLRDRALVGAADGAAAAAAGAVEPRSARDGGLGVVLSAGAARAEVARYVAEGGLAERFGPGFAYDVDVDGPSVTVTLHSDVGLPVLGHVPLSARSSARSVLLP